MTSPCQVWLSPSPATVDLDRTETTGPESQGNTWCVLNGHSMCPSCLVLLCFGGVHRRRPGHRTEAPVLKAPSPAFSDVPRPYVLGPETPLLDRYHDRDPAPDHVTGYGPSLRLDNRHLPRSSYRLSTHVLIDLEGSPILTRYVQAQGSHLFPRSVVYRKPHTDNSLIRCTK